MRLLGFTSNGGVTNWLPLFLFVILFGLSMDYHVFILTRIRELYDQGMSTEDAVRKGIAGSAGTVTTAAVVMVLVFSVFATLSFIDFKEMGVGLAVAILIDATIIRGVLLPASMRLLGDWNWYLPKAAQLAPHDQGRVRIQADGRAGPGVTPNRIQVATAAVPAQRGPGPPPVRLGSEQRLLQDVEHVRVVVDAGELLGQRADRGHRDVSARVLGGRPVGLEERDSCP